MIVQASNAQTNLALCLWEVILCDRHLRRYGSAGKIHTLARSRPFEAFQQHESEQSGGYAGTEEAGSTFTGVRYLWVEE